MKHSYALYSIATRCWSSVRQASISGSRGDAYMIPVMLTAALAAAHTDRSRRAVLRLRAGQWDGQPQQAGGYPPQQGYPPPGYPQPGYPPQQQPPPGYHQTPPQGMPPRGMPPQGMPPQGMPPQGMPQYGAPGQQRYAPPELTDMVRVAVRPGPQGAELDTAALPKLSQAQADALHEAPPPAAVAMQTSFRSVADTGALQASLGLPFGALVQPLASEPPQIRAPPGAGPDYSLVVRCKNCRGYLNPGVELHEHVGKWTCNLCGHHNDLPPPPPPPMGAPPAMGGGGGGGMFGGLWGGGQQPQQPQPQYAAPLPVAQQRLELQKAEVEYVLGGQEAVEYSTYGAGGAGHTLVLALDVSRGAVESCALKAACEAAARSIDELVALGAGGGVSRVALLTYDRNVHVWRLRGDGRPPLSVVLPAARGMPQPVAPAAQLHNLTAHHAALTELLRALPAMHAEPKEAKAAREAAVQMAAQMAATSGADDDDTDAEPPNGGAALPAAVHAALALLEGAPGSLMVLSGSGATAGPARCERSLPEPPAAQDEVATHAAALERLTRAESRDLEKLGR